jgi:zinc protease
MDLQQRIGRSRSASGTHRGCHLPGGTPHEQLRRLAESLGHSPDDQRTAWKWALFAFLSCFHPFVLSGFSAGRRCQSRCQTSNFKAASCLAQPKICRRWQENNAATTFFTWSSLMTSMTGNGTWLSSIVITLMVGVVVADGAPPTKLTTVEGITEYALDNGLQVLLFPDPSKPTITVNMTYRVGSRHEGRGEAGMAHLLEHMVFKGTPTYPTIWGALEDHGASFNGTTWVDRTNYFETLPASDDNLDFALRMEADRMVNSLISDDALAKEMTVVRNEFEMGENNPEGVLSERMLSAAYLWHNYGKSTIGNRSDIERVPGTSLRRFYRKYYQPDNATLLVAGRFETDHALKLITKYFGAIPQPTRKLDDTYTEEPPQDGARLVTLKRVGDVAAAGLVYHIPAGSHAEFPAVEVLQEILTSQPSGRLYRQLVIPGLATNVSGSAFAWAEPGVLELRAQVATEKKPQRVLDTMIETVERFAADAATDEEVERAKTSLLKEIKLALTNSSAIGIRLSEFIAQGDWRMFFIHRDRLEHVTPSDVQLVADKYLVESNRTAGLFLPTEEAMRVAVGKTPDVRELVRDYRGSHQIAQGERLRPDVDFIEQRVQRRTLPSGIRIALLPIETRGDAVHAAFRLHYGTESALTGQVTAAELIPSMLMRGTKNRDYQQLRDEIDRLQSRIFVGGGGGGRGGRRGGGGAGGTEGPGVVRAAIESDRENFLPAIELLGEILREPAFDAGEFAIVVNQQRSFLQQGLSDPGIQGMVALSRALNPWPADSVHYVPTTEERIERMNAVTLPEVKHLYEAQYGASHLEVAVVGDFDADEVADSVEAVFGSWKSASPYERIPRPYRSIEPEQIVISTPDKEMAMVAMGTALEIRDDDPDYPALVLASYVLGQSSKSRLINRLRHEGGLSYGAGAMFNASSQDRRGSLVATAICAPQNAAKALDGIRTEVTEWIHQGITEEELAEARHSYALKFENRLANEQFLVNELVEGLEIDRTLGFQKQLLGKIEALSATGIRQSIQKVLGGAPMVEMSAGDLRPAESGAETTAAAGRSPDRGTR